MYVKRCFGCDQLFEVAEAQARTSDSLQKPEGIMRTQPVDICPPCRQAAQIRGQEPPAQEAEPGVHEKVTDPAAQGEEGGDTGPDRTDDVDL